MYLGMVFNHQIITHIKLLKYVHILVLQYTQEFPLKIKLENY